MVPACIPAAVGSPRNQSAEPANAGVAVIIGIHGRALLAVMTSPCAVSGSALMICMLTRDPAGTMRVGLTSPAMRKVSSGPPGGLATTARWMLAPVKVTVFLAALTLAPAGTWLASRAACAALTRGPGALAHSLPMIWPGSVVVPIMELGSPPPRIQPGAVVPPIIHRYPRGPIIQPAGDPPIIEPPM